MKSPSTTWQEEISPDEEERFARYSATLKAIQANKTKKFGNGRALHRKAVLGLCATVEILPDLPSYAAFGLFAAPAQHEAWIRLSNGSPDRKPDHVRDIRGFALKVLGVSGDSALGNGPARSQDFVLINREVFGFAKSDEFMELVGALAHGPLGVLAHMIRRYGVFSGLGRVARLQRSMKRPFTGFATESFFSAAPIACGPYAVRVRLVPDAPPPQAPSADWSADMLAHLARAPLSFTMQLQFFVDEATTPIENGAQDWSEREAPYVNVARVRIPMQTGDAALAAQIEAAAFDPWSALAVHRPLGEIMRARKAAYFASQQGRTSPPSAA
jgi:hypothetical protein